MPNGDAITCVFFGCWNDITYRTVSSSSEPPRDVVLDKVKEVLRHGSDMMIVAGDNIYGLKNKKKQDGKTVKDSYFSKKSMNVLQDNYWKKDKGSSIFLFALGNHNVENKPIYNAIQASLRQFKADGVYEDEHNSRLKYPHFYSYEKSKGTAKALFIVIDTNVFDNAYERFGENRQDEASRAKACSWISRQIQKANDERSQAVIVGHHPIACMKEDAKVAELGLFHGKQLLDCLTSAGKQSLTYLCADRHNYQHAEIKHNGCTLTQIVSGTGGAKPDVFSAGLLKTFSRIPTTVNDRLKVTIPCPGLGVGVTFLQIKNAFGVCILNVTRSGVTVKYVPVSIKGSNQDDRVQMANSFVQDSGNDIEINKTFKYTIPDNELLHFYSVSKKEK